MADLSSKFPNMFFTLGNTTALAEDVVGILSQMREDGQMGDKIAMVNVADAFGIELATAARPLFEAAGFDIVYDSSYPLGTQDLSPVIKAAKAAEPDAFVAWSYPPDTFGLTEQAMIEDLQVKAFYTAWRRPSPPMANGSARSRAEPRPANGAVGPYRDPVLVSTSSAVRLSSQRLRIGRSGSAPT